MFVFTDSKLARSKAKRARADIVEHFSYTAVANKVIERLGLIQKALPEVKQLKMASYNVGSLNIRI